VVEAEVGRPLHVVTVYGFDSGRRAFEAMVDMAAYEWNWTDRVFVRERGSWSEDGPFHWYTYQWSTNAVPGANYGILVI
jgi:hypothetical protein